MLGEGMNDQGEEEASCFQVIPVNITEKFHIAGRDPFERKREIGITRQSLDALVESALAPYPPNWGTAPVCVVSGDRPPDVKFETREHFVPEGLGFSWAFLRAGAGTCDRVNHEFSKYEAEWLRQGDMGCFRPFFVADGKDEPPAYYAPTMRNKLVWFTRGPDGSRQPRLGLGAGALTVQGEW